MTEPSGLAREELWLYSRQIVLDEIGLEGQEKLKKSRVLVAGVGGLGTPITLQLTAMGVGHLRVVDRDIISMSDLHRQYLYDVSSVGLPKVEVAASKLSALNPRVNIEPVPISIRHWNVKDLLEQIDVVIDGLDSVEARYLINRACVKLGIPYVYGGAVRTEGMVSTIMPRRTPCLECFQPNLKDEDLPKCAVVGVYTPLIGIVASIEVSETIRLLTGKQPKLAGRLLFIDASTLSFDEITLAHHEKCPICSDTVKPPSPLTEKQIEEQCSRDGRTTLVITPQEWLEIDLAAVRDHIVELGYSEDRRGRLGLTATNEKGLTVGLLKTGVAIFQIPPSRASSNMHREALALYEELQVLMHTSSKEVYLRYK